MDPDLLLVIGLVIGLFTVPSMLSAFSESRAPRAASIMVLIAGVFVVVAVMNKPNGYNVDDVPDVFFHVIGRYLN
jgi:hypothetical protein